ncbi:hypothetical protein FB451DRAFT_1239747 [Mycena latifolia]|nr:hypothetical protein FB451DRAFT_1239747 [Mycena latifolia]
MPQRTHPSPFACPVLDLPNEIVSEIFINVLPIYPHRPPPIGRLSPTLLGQICSQWRDIALSTPQLWRAIELKLVNCAASASYLAILQTWLARSRDSRLSLSLEYDAFDATGTFSLPVLTQFIKTIVPHSGRWEYAELMVPLTLVPLLQGAMPELRSLTFGPSYFSREVSSIFEPASILAFHDAPKLNTVVLSRYFAPSSTTLPWVQITTLTAECLHFHECLEVLHHAVNLVDCTLTLRYDEFEETVTHPPVPPLRQLESLSLLNGDPADDSQQKLLAELTLPALQRLQVSARWFRKDPRQIIASLISRSCCAPMELVVTEACAVSAKEYRAALPTISNIVVQHMAEMPQAAVHTPPSGGQLQPHGVVKSRATEVASLEFWSPLVSLLHLLFRWSGAFLSLFDDRNPRM